MNNDLIIHAHAQNLREYLEKARAREGRRDIATDDVFDRIESTVEELNVAEEELRAQNEELLASRSEIEAERERYRELFESAPDAYLETDAAGVIQEANRAAGSLLGVRPDRLQGKPVTVFIPSEDRGRFFVYLDAARNSREESTPFEMPIHPRDGTPRAVQVRVRAADRGTRLRWILRDETDRKRAQATERQLRLEQNMRAASEAGMRQERFLSESSEALSEVIDLEMLHVLITQLPIPYLCDAAALDLVTDRGECVRVSSHGTGEESDELLSYLLPPSSDAIENVMTTGQPEVINGGEVFGLPGASRHPFAAATGLVLPLSARGRLIGTLSIVRSDPERSCGRDIMLAKAYAHRAAFALDNVRLLRDASSARKAMSDMVKMLSHEFRTPLASVLGYADLILTGTAGTLNDLQMSFLRNLRSSAWNLGTLIDDVLTSFRDESIDGSDTVHPIAIDAVALLADIRSVIEPEAAAKGLEVVVRCPQLTLTSDLTKLRQILINLTANAVKYSDHGSVLLEAEPRMGGVEFRVTDTGPGIAADDVSRIFDEFWQGNRNPVRTGGVGLGLALSRRLARLLGGDILVSSERGLGSTFSVWLPQLKRIA